MKIIDLTDVQLRETTAPLFTGGTVSRADLVGSDTSGSLRIGLVRFEAGARNIFHTHTVDQILYVVEGRGIAATEQQEYIITPGSLVFIPAGERHWHGATSDAPMAHLTITPTGNETKM